MTNSSSEFRAGGILGKFGYAFGKAGGTVDTMNWVANHPEHMEEIVKIADKWFLIDGTPLTYKFSSPLTYNPAECFRVGTHDGVRIVRIVGKVHLFAVDEERVVERVSFMPYSLRRAAERAGIAIEAHRLGIDIRSSVDSLWAALRHAARAPATSVLIMDGCINDLLVPHKTNSGIHHFPVQLKYLTDKEGWEIRAPMSLDTMEILPVGTRLIFEGDKNG